MYWLENLGEANEGNAAFLRGYCKKGRLWPGVSLFDCFKATCGVISGDPGPTVASAAAHEMNIGVGEIQ